MRYLVRSQVLTGYATLARALGLAPELLAKAAGLELAALADLDARISARAFAELLENSARAASIDDFGIRLAETRGLGILGPVGIVMREEADLRSALGALVRYLPVHNEALVLRLSEEERIVALELQVRPLGNFLPRHFTELSLGAFFRIIRRFLGPHWSPIRVTFEHPAPKDCSLHRRFFGCPVEFAEEANALFFPVSDLNAPISLSDAMLASYARRYLESMAQHRDASATEKVRELVRLWLPTGSCSASHVARALGVDRRSMHRYLHQEGHSFLSVLNDVRAEMASRLVCGGRPLCEVAEVVGFSGTAAFSRWFSQQFGCNPSSWRRLSDAERARRRVPLRNGSGNGRGRGEQRRSSTPPK